VNALNHLHAPARNGNTLAVTKPLYNEMGGAQQQAFWEDPKTTELGHYVRVVPTIQWSCAPTIKSRRNNGRLDVHHLGWCMLSPLVACAIKKILELVDRVDARAHKKASDSERGKIGCL
jgi:hypothetical protein